MPFSNYETFAAALLSPRAHTLSRHNLLQSAEPRSRWTYGRHKRTHLNGHKGVHVLLSRLRIVGHAALAVGDQAAVQGLPVGAWQGEEAAILNCGILQR